MDARGVRNMYSILVVFNKHNTARVASCWFIMYYRLVMHGNSNIKFLVLFHTLLYRYGFIEATTIIVNNLAEVRFILPLSDVFLSLYDLH